MANINSTSLRNNLVQSLTMSGNLTWAKADFKGKFTVFITTNSATTRVLTISNTDFVAGDFLCLLINQNSSGDVSVTIGTRSIADNRGNIINAIFDGTNWNVWSGGGVFNTSSSTFTSTSFGLRNKAGSEASSYGTISTAMGLNASAFGYAVESSGTLGAGMATLLLLNTGVVPAATRSAITALRGSARIALTVVLFNFAT